MINDQLVYYGIIFRLIYLCSDNILIGFVYELY